ncbi:HigA family addiction module antitoxin [Tunicatimonas pelagia]|uniref:HigA family addiction module antitoxin n=1 Tax=Tunicatimonas pelagia TaxID=931531 RepID=UPI0026665B73|nr:HigA family addiction module antitoxin [Tunicatimonas pelagia]WKN40808.1 HigA family addiction module antitoxin [Tunicatimonas pelagia]
MAMFNPAHPGELIRETIEGIREETGEKLPIREVAEGLGVSQKTLDAILNGRQSVTPIMALRLEKAFPNTDAMFWLRAQENYDLAQARQAFEPKGIRQFWQPTVYTTIEKSNSMLIQYPSDEFTEYELKMFESELNKNGIGLYKYSFTGKAYAFNSDELGTIVYLIQFTILKQIILGGIYDIFKAHVIRLWNHWKNKKITRLSTKQKTEVPPGLKFKYAKSKDEYVEIELTDITEKQFDKALDRLIEFSKEFVLEKRKLTKDRYYYNRKTGQWTKK